MGDSPIGDSMVHQNSNLSLEVEVKSKKHLDQALIELKESILGKLNDSFSLGGWCLEVPPEVMYSLYIWFEESDS